MDFSSFAESSKLILHRFYSVTVSDFNLICSLDFAGLLSVLHSDLIPVTHVVYVLCAGVLQFYHV